MAKQALKHQSNHVKYHGSWEEHIQVTTGVKYFSWDGKYFDRKERAAAHKKQILDGEKEQDFWSGGLRVFKTQNGWGVFAQV